MFRPGSNVTIPPMVSVFNAQVGWVDESIAASAPVSATLGAGVAWYYPIILPNSCTVRRVWWANGASATGTNYVGIYADDGDAKPGALLISASAAASGTNAIQFADVTDTIIGPGRYWLALSNPSGSSVFRSAMVSAYEAGYLYLEIYDGLPTTATPAEATSADVFLFGFSTVASP